MSRTFLCVLALSLTTGCAVPHTLTRHNLSAARYDATSQDAVWSRALLEFQKHGILIAACNEKAAFLRSDVQTTTVACNDDAGCPAQTIHQLTLSGGTAVLRVNRVVTVTTYDREWRYFSDDHEKALQTEANDLLTAIVKGAQP